MYREGLLILCIFLLIVGAVVAHFAPGIIGEVFFWVAVAGGIGLLIWVALVILDYIKTGR